MALHAVLFDMGQTLLHYPRPGDGSWRAFEAAGTTQVYDLLEERGLAPRIDRDGFIDLLFERIVASWRSAVVHSEPLTAHTWLAAGLVASGVACDAGLLDTAVDRYVAPLRQGVHPAPYARDTLVALRARGLRLGLISNTFWPAAYHRADLAAAGLIDLLDDTRFSGEEGVWKPAPGIFRRALAALRVAAPDAVFVGDSPLEDIRGAQGVGLRAVWKRSTEFELVDGVVPDGQIDELPELLPIIDAWM